MVHPQLHCEIRVGVTLDPCWFDWFEGLTVTNLEQGGAVLAGSLPDRAALHGVLGRIRDLNLVLISLQIKEQGQPSNSRGDLQEGI
jgi:hypothetical protein